MYGDISRLSLSLRNFWSLAASTSKPIKGNIRLGRALFPEVATMYNAQTILLYLVASWSAYAAKFETHLRSVATARALRLRHDLVSSRGQKAAIRPLEAAKALLPFSVRYDSAYEWYVVDVSLGTPRTCTPCFCF